MDEKHRLKFQNNLTQLLLRTFSVSCQIQLRSLKDTCVWIGLTHVIIVVEVDFRCDYSILCVCVCVGGESDAAQMGLGSGQFSHCR